MDQERIKEILARCEAATPGPWEVEKYYYTEPGYEEDIRFAAVVHKARGANGTVVRSHWSNPAERDIEFIAHARKDIPDLLDYIAELEKKQIPRLPEGILIDSGTDFNLRCPCCGYKFVSSIGGEYAAVVYAKHCPSCGQAIRWS